MKYYLYRITNKVNNKIYVGVHKTKNESDRYMGSGKVIRRAIAKHGIENFQKEILEYFDTAAEMYEREKEFVTQEFLDRDDVYNLRRGGFGGFDYINASNIDRKERGRKSQRLHPHVRDNLIKGLNPSFIAGRKTSSRFSGKRHTLESKMKISFSNSKMTKEKNSQYGTKWICNLELRENRKLKANETIPNGWILGRNRWNNYGG